MQVYKEKSNCTGCRACEMVCPNRCINMSVDEEGFLYPIIDEEKCTRCGLCERVCSDGESYAEEPKHLTYAVKNIDDKIRCMSSSGGVFYELAKKVLQNDGVVFGAAFDENFEVCQKAIDSIENLAELMGSKYVQSDTKSTYVEVKKNLEEERLVLYSGTPCQIAGLKKYLQRDYVNLVCISVICHGVPSPEVWRRYITYKKAETCSEVIKQIAFRDKVESWREFHFAMEFNNTSVSSRLNEDFYGKGFLQNLYLRPSCYQCKFKGDNCNADIILGDYWGIEYVHPEMDDRKGVSAVSINTQKGQILFESVTAGFEITLSDYRYCEQYNSALVQSVAYNSKRTLFFEELRETENVVEAIKNNLKFEINKEARRIHHYPIVMKYLQNKMKGWSVCDFLKQYSYKNVVLYAMTEFAELVKEDIFTCENQSGNLSLCDTNASNYPNGYSGLPVIGVEQLVERYRAGEVDCIIVCSIFHRNAIIKSLMDKGIAQECIVSIASVVYST